MGKLDISTVPRRCIITGPVEAVYVPSVRALCRKAYGNHPKGCPKFGRHPDCPPHAPLFVRVYLPTVRVVAVRFDFGGYIRRKREMHPGWTDRALANPRHWQGHVRAELRRFVKRGCGGVLVPEDVVIWNPEAMGVNVTETCRRADIMLEWPPERYHHEVALIGRRR